MTDGWSWRREEEGGRELGKIDCGGKGGLELALMVLVTREGKEKGESTMQVGKECLTNC